LLGFAVLKRKCRQQRARAFVIIVYSMPERAKKHNTAIPHISRISGANVDVETDSQKHQSEEREGEPYATYSEETNADVAECSASSLGTESF